MRENVYGDLNARSKVYLSKEYFCKIYPTCMSSTLCEFIYCVKSRYNIKAMAGPGMIRLTEQAMSKLIAKVSTPVSIS